MLSKLKQKLTAKIVDELFEAHRPQSVSDLKKVAVIVDVSLFGREFQLSEFLKAFDLKEASVYPILFSSEKNTIDKEAKVFSKKDVSWLGKLKAETDAEEFIQQEYDVLINYFQQESHELFLLSASVKAKLKVGFQMNEKRLNDFELLESPKKTRLFAVEMKKYIPLINQ